MGSLDFTYGNAELFNQLGTLTSISSIYMEFGNWYLNWSDTDIDLSGMSGLRTITMKNVNFKSLTLPRGVNSITFENCGIFPNLSNLNNITYLRFAKSGSNDNVASSNVLTSISSKTWNEDERIDLQLSGLTEISNLSNILNKFNAKALTIQNCKNVPNLIGISSMINLETLILKDNLGLITLSGLGSLDSLTSLTMNNCSVTDLTELTNMTSLNYIDLKNSLFGGDNLKILVGLREKNANLKLYLARM